MRLLRFLPSIGVVLLVGLAVAASRMPDHTVRIAGVRVVEHGRVGRPLRLAAALAFLQCLVAARLRRVAGRALRAAERLCAKRTAIWAIAAALLVVLIWLKTAQHRAFETHAGDLATFDLAISNTLRGAFMYTPMPSDARGCLLAMHFYALLPLFLPFYLIWDSPYVLLVFQAVAVALSVIPLWSYARTQFQEPFVAVVLALAFVMSPYIVNGFFFDFHPEMAVPLFLLACFASYERRRLAWYALFALLAAMCREDVAVYLVGWGLYVAFVRRDYKVGAATAALSLLYAAIAVKVMIPLFSPPGVTHSKLMMTRYAPYGTSVPSVLWGMATHPLRLAHDLFRRAPLMLMLSVLFLPLVAPMSFALLCAMPLVAALTATTSGMRGLRLYAAAPILPFLYVAALAGLARVCRWRPARRRQILWSCCIVMLLLAGGDWRWPRVTPRDRFAAEFIAAIPPDASVKASYDLVPHLPRRTDAYYQHVYVVDGSGDRVPTDYVVLDTRANPFPLDRPAFEQLVATYRAHPLYAVSMEQEGFLVLRRKPHGTASDPPGGLKPPGGRRAN